MKHELTNQRTRQMFAASLRRLLEKKALSKITVSEIAADCGVNRKTFYYVYDYDEYTSANGTNIRLFDEMPGCVFRDASEIAKALEKPYRQDCLDNYRKKYLPQELGTSTSKLADLILEKKGQQDV